MLHKFLKKYISIIFIISTLVGIFHHHNDLKQHSDCKICVVKSNITDIDTPSEVKYFTKLDIISEYIVAKLINFHIRNPKNPLQARAPPFFLS